MTYLYYGLGITFIVAGLETSENMASIYDGGAAVFAFLFGILFVGCSSHILTQNKW